MDYPHAFFFALSSDEFRLIGINFVSIMWCFCLYTIFVKCPNLVFFLFSLLLCDAFTFLSGFSFKLLLDVRIGCFRFFFFFYNNATAISSLSLSHWISSMLFDLNRMNHFDPNRMKHFILKTFHCFETTAKIIIE